jgi:hypothetical protein
MKTRSRYWTDYKLLLLKLPSGREGDRQEAQSIFTEAGVDASFMSAPGR